MATENEEAKTAVGCAQIVSVFPAMVIWYFLFGAMLHKTNDGVMEWSLYVGYLVCSVTGLIIGSFSKFMK